MTPMTEAVRRLRSLGFGLCRILANEKIPTYAGWTKFSVEAGDFEAHPGANLGILGGTLSGGLVIVDPDRPEVRAAALERLPRTMTDHRASATPGHLYYRVTDVPTWATAGVNVAGGIGGPRIMHFADAAKRPIGLDFIGTGGQVVCPPSMHDSGEQRTWMVDPEKILTLPYLELWSLVKQLAIHFDARNVDRENDARPMEPAAQREPWSATSEVSERAIKYLAKCNPAISGQGGHAATFTAARVVVWGFDLGADAGFELLQQHYNRRCQPPWSDAELMHKCEDADAVPSKHKRGWLRDKPPPKQESSDDGEEEFNDGHSDSWEGPEAPEVVRVQKVEPSKNGKIETFTAAELVVMVLPETKWAVKDLLPQGLSFLAGKPKTGKSWWALDVSLAIAFGGTALGTIDVEPGDVLYLAMEDTKRRLQDRVKKVMASMGDKAPEALTFATKWPRQDKGGILALAEWLEEHKGRARLVVIDTWAKFRPPKSAGGNDYDQDYEHASEVKGLADKYGVAVLPVHHCRKLAGDDPMDSLSGTLGLTGAADGAIIIRRERGQLDAVMFVSGRDVDEREDALRWDKATCTWSILGNAASYRMSKERQKVVELLAKKPMTPAEVCYALDKPLAGVKSMLYRMAEAGQIVSVGRGLFSASSEQVAELQSASNSSNSRNSGNYSNSSNSYSDEYSSDDVQW